MKFKEVYLKSSYLKEHYPFNDVPKLTDKKHCIHCGENITVGDYKVAIENGEEYIVCPNAPKCDGTVMDWIKLRTT